MGCGRSGALAGRQTSPHPAQRVPAPGMGGRACACAAGGRDGSRGAVSKLLRCEAAPYQPRWKGRKRGVVDRASISQGNSCARARSTATSESLVHSTAECRKRAGPAENPKRGLLVGTRSSAAAQPAGRATAPASSRSRSHALIVHARGAAPSLIHIASSLPSALWCSAGALSSINTTLIARAGRTEICPPRAALRSRTPQPHSAAPHR